MTDPFGGSTPLQPAPAAPATVQQWPPRPTPPPQPLPPAAAHPAWPPQSAPSTGQPTPVVAHGVPVVDDFGDPLATGNYPGMGALRDRLLLITPHKREVVPQRTDDGGTREQTRLTCDVIVLSAAFNEAGQQTAAPVPFVWLDNDGNQQIQSERGGKAHAIDGTGRIAVELEQLFIGSAGLVPQLEALLRPGSQQKRALGRLRKMPGQGGRKGAWRLEKATEADKQIARNWLASRPAFG